MLYHFEISSEISWQNRTKIVKNFGQKLKKNVNKIIKEIPKSTYKNLFKGSYERNSKYLPKKSRLKPLKHYK